MKFPPPPLPPGFTQETGITARSKFRLFNVQAVRHKILENEPTATASPDDDLPPELSEKTAKRAADAFVANLIESVVSVSSPSKDDGDKSLFRFPDPSKITPDAKSAPKKAR